MTLSCWLAAPLALALCLAVPAPAPLAATAPASRPAASQPASPGQDELRAEVPELNAFHEVIARLWHTAWPNKDVALMKELLPRVQADFLAVKKATLPGILRDRKPQWDKGLAAMDEAVERYAKAAAGSDPAALLDAVEALHGRFEDQFRIVRPSMNELGAYHVGLYQVFHRFLPGRDLPALRAMVDTMEVRCAGLAAAEPPRWFKGDRAVLDQGRAELCARTRALKGVAAGTDWSRIQAAVDAVHGQYQKLEALFE